MSSKSKPDSWIRSMRLWIPLGVLTMIIAAATAAVFLLLPGNHVGATLRAGMKQELIVGSVLLWAVCLISAWLTRRWALRSARVTAAGKAALTDAWKRCEGKRSVLVGSSGWVCMFAAITTGEAGLLLLSLVSASMLSGSIPSLERLTSFERAARSQRTSLTTPAGSKREAEIDSPDGTV